MARGQGTVTVKILGDAKGLKGAFSEAEGAVGAFGRRMPGMVAAGAAAAGAAIGAVALKGIADFASFDQQMREVFTLMPGISDQAMGDMTDQVKEFSTQFGVLPNEVVPALYSSLSAGVPAGNVFDFLETAQQAAKGGVTDLDTAVQGIASTVNAYGDDVLSAGQASDLMFTAVKLGITTFEDMSGALFNVTPIASSLGVEFGNVTAAIAAMTAKGTPTRSATTQIRQALVEMSKEGTKASGVFEDMAGESFTDFIAGGGNLQGALQLMEQAAAESNVSISDLFGSVEAGMAALTLTGGGTQAFTDALAEMENAGGATAEAFETMNQGIGPTFDRLKASVSVALIEIGEALAPVVNSFLDWAERVMPDVQRVAGEVFTTIGAVVADWWPKIVLAFETVKEAIRVVWDFVSGIFDSFRGTLQDNEGQASGWMDRIKEIFTNVKDIIGSVIDVIMGVFDVFVTTATILWDTFGETIMGFVKGTWDSILRIIDGVMEAVMGVWDVFAGIFTGDWQRVWGGIKSFFSGIWDALVGIVSQMINAIESTISAVLDVIKEVWNAAWSGIKDFFGGVWDGIVSAAKAGVNAVIGFINAMIRAWNSLEFTVPEIGVGPVSFGGFTVGLPDLPQIPTLGDGGIVTRPTLAVVGEAGPEAVIPLRGRGAMGGTTVQVIVQGSVVSERDLAQVVREQLIEVGRRNSNIFGGLA